MARPVTVTIPHALGRDEARRRIEQGFGQLRQQMTGGIAAVLAMDQRWEGDRLHFAGGALGQTITGQVDIHDDSVQIQVNLPDFLAAVADRIAAKLKTAGRQLLERK